MSTHDTHAVSEHEMLHHHTELKRDKNHHLVTFGLSIILTVLAFIAVAYEAIPRSFTIPFILGLGVVQAAFQGLVWMHLNQKGHRYANIFMLSGILMAFITVLCFVFLIWW